MGHGPHTQEHDGLNGAKDQCMNEAGKYMLGCRHTHTHTHTHTQFLKQRHQLGAEVDVNNVH